MGKEQKKQLSIWRLIIAGLIVVLLLTMVGGCSSENIITNKTKASTITVTDQAGRVVEVPSEVKSIATFGPLAVLNTLVEVMGCGDRIVNNMPANFSSVPYHYVFAPQIANGPILENSGTIDIEAVLKLNPDLCLCMSKAYVNVLEEKGLCVIYLEWQILSDVEKCMTLLGEVLGKQKEAADYLNYFNRIVSEAEALTAGIPDTEKKTVLYGYIPTYTQPHTIAEWWITKSGGISVSDNGRDMTVVSSYIYTLEDLLLWDPDVLVPTTTAQVEELLADKRFGELTAVINNDIYIVPTVGNNMGSRTPEQPIVILWLMNKLYPNIMPTERLADEIYYFYSHFFHYNLTEEQITEIIG